jgi:hypothetical protein
MVNEMIDEFEKTHRKTWTRYFAKHSVDHAKAFVDAVEEYKQK